MGDPEGAVLFVSRFWVLRLGLRSRRMFWVDFESWGSREPPLGLRSRGI